jgi:endonuclease-3
VIDTKTFIEILKILEKEHTKWNAPVISLVSRRTNDPFRVLVFTILSLRTKDEITHKAGNALFAKINGPADLLELDE